MFFSRRIPKQVPLQMAQLRGLMQQADAEWEELTQSIQADRERLEALQRRQENFRLLLALDGKRSSNQSRAITAQVATLKEQIGQLEQRVALECTRRRAITRRFEQARLELIKLRNPSPGQRRLARTSGLLARCVTRPLRGFWTAMRQPGESSEILPGDAFLKRHM